MVGDRGRRQAPSAREGTARARLSGLPGALLLRAAFDDRDDDHASCAELLATAREPRVIPAPVLVELDYFLTRRLGPEPMTRLLTDVRSGGYEIEPLYSEDYERVSTLMKMYADLQVGFVDASVLAVVERLREPKLATLDRRRFGAMRPRHVEALTLVPA
jgi:predicted nucleic acid-binding protein